jgi:hypothetical protein
MARIAHPDIIEEIPEDGADKQIRRVKQDKEKPDHADGRGPQAPPGCLGNQRPMQPASDLG